MRRVALVQRMKNAPAGPGVFISATFNHSPGDVSITLRRQFASTVLDLPFSANRSNTRAPAADQDQTMRSVRDAFRLPVASSSVESFGTLAVRWYNLPSDL